MIAKIALLISLVSSLALASHWSAHGGHSNTWRKQDGSGNYGFGYDIVDGKGAKNSRQEWGDGWGNKHGSYSLHDVDGRSRTVVYVADKSGFHANIKTNEPGTGHLDAANAIYNGPDEHGGSYTHVISGGHHGGNGGWGHGGHQHGWHGWH